MDEMIMSAESRMSTAPRSNGMEMMISRQAQEVQGAIVMAKKFPRDEYTAVEKIKRSCQRFTLAETAMYSYPRGKDDRGKPQIVTGPSIRLAEEIARLWGNIDCGVIELSHSESDGSNQNMYGFSEMMAYAWDLESNTRVSKIFTVEHKRNTKKGTFRLTDSRDIYEATANFGARRLRACILGVIPGDVVEEAVKVCQSTIAAGDGRSFQDRLSALLKVFKKEFSVTKEQIEKYTGMNVAEFGNEEIIDLQGVYRALKDGQAKVSDFFEAEKKTAEDAFADATEKGEQKQEARNMESDSAMQMEMDEVFGK